MTFFEELRDSLLEAIAIEKGEIPMVELPNMPAPTFVPKSVFEEEQEACNRKQIV